MSSMEAIGIGIQFQLLVVVWYLSRIARGISRDKEGDER
jgi:uncharacterized membrane protein